MNTINIFQHRERHKNQHNHCKHRYLDTKVDDSGRKIFGFFSAGFLPTSRAFRQKLGGKHWKKSEKFPAGILLPQNYRNSQEPAVSGLDSAKRLERMI